MLVTGVERRMATVRDLLSDGQVWRGKDLAGRAGIQERTLYRYIRALKKQGLPIRGEAGVGYMMKGNPMTTIQQIGNAVQRLQLLLEGIGIKSLVLEFSSDDMRHLIASAKLETPFYDASKGADGIMGVPIREKSSTENRTFSAPLEIDWKKMAASLENSSNSLAEQADRAKLRGEDKQAICLQSAGYVAGILRAAVLDGIGE